MELGVADRLRLLSILPSEGNLVTLKIVRDLQQELSFSEAELTALKVRQEGTRVMWDETAETLKAIPIGEKATDIIVDRLKELNRQQKLTLEILPLYERFIKDS